MLYPLFHLFCRKSKHVEDNNFTLYLGGNLQLEIIYLFYLVSSKDNNMVMVEIDAVLSSISSCTRNLKNFHAFRG